jgi:6-phosphofructokinase
MSLKGNVLIGQSGGPTSVINSSLHSIITEAKKYGFISDIYGAIHGIEGVLNKQLIDLRLETDETIEGLTRTPGAALGGCRHKVQESDLETIFKVFDSLNIKYFFYIGGNDSMDTADRLNKAAGELYSIRNAGKHFMPVVTTIHQNIQGFDTRCSDKDTLPESDIQKVYD